MKRPTLLVLLTAFIACASLAAGSEDRVARRAVEAALGAAAGKIDAVREAGFLNLLEVEASGEIFYVDKQGSYALMGDIIDIKGKRNLTEERRNKLTRRLIDNNLKLAIKQVRGNGGNGQRTLVTFEDPNCGYCKKLANELKGLNDATIYTFLYPILSADSSAKSSAIWCAKDRARAWNDWMLNQVEPPKADCAAPIDELMRLGEKLRIHGTPAIYFPDGSAAPGFIRLADIEKGLKQTKRGE